MFYTLIRDKDIPEGIRSESKKELYKIEKQEEQKEKLRTFIAYVKKEKHEFTPYEDVNKSESKDGFYYVPAPNYKIKNNRKYFKHSYNRVTFELMDNYNEKKAKKLLELPISKEVPTVYTKHGKLLITNDIVNDYLEIINKWNDANLPISKDEYFLIVTKRKAIVFNYDAVMHNYKQITDLSRWWCVPTSVD